MWISFYRLFLFLVKDFEHRTILSGSPIGIGKIHNFVIFVKATLAGIEVSSLSMKKNRCQDP